MPYVCQIKHFLIPLPSILETMSSIFDVTWLASLNSSPSACSPNLQNDLVEFRWCLLIYTCNIFSFCTDELWYHFFNPNPKPNLKHNCNPKPIVYLWQNKAPVQQLMDTWYLSFIWSFHLEYTYIFVQNSLS